MTLTKELFNDLKGTMRNTPLAPPLGSGVLLRDIHKERHTHRERQTETHTDIQRERDI